MDSEKWLKENNIELIKKLGEGSYGKVYKAIYNQQIVAIKVFISIQN